MSRHDIVRLVTTDDQLHDLAEAADTRRAFVRVDRQALINLVMDHGTLAARLYRNGIEARGPEDKPAAPPRRKLTRKGE